MQKQPLLIMFACFIAGIFLCDYFLFSFNISLLFLIVSGVLVLISFFKFYIFRKFKFLFLGIFFISVGVFSHFLNSQKPELPHFEGKKSIVFKLTKKLNSNEKYRRYEIATITKTGDKNFHFNAVISIPKESRALDFKNFYRTETYLNQVEKPDNNFQFNYAQYLERKKIYYQCFASDEVFISPKKEISFTANIKQKRSEFLENIDQSPLETPVKEFLKGIILADRTEMDAEMVSDFSKSGLVHFLAISGTHFAIIFWMILFLLKPLFSAKNRNITIVISLVLLWLFAVFIDYGSSVVRSCLMITAYYSFVIFQRKPDLLHALSIAGFGILIVDTHQLFDIGFQLSFLAVLGIFWLNEPIQKFLPRPKNNVQNFFVNILSISFAAQISTLPLVIFYFHQYSFISIVANLVILPFSEIIIIFSLLMTILFAFKIEIYQLSFLYEKIVEVLLWVIHFFAKQDWFFVKNIPLSVLELIIALLAVYYLRYVLKNFSYHTVIQFSFVVIVFLGVRISMNWCFFEKSEMATVHYFKQKIFLIKNKGEVVFWLEKSAPKDKIVKSIIEPYLSSRRISRYKIEELPENSEQVEINGAYFKIK